MPIGQALTRKALVTTKDGHKIVVKATTNVEDLKKIASA